MKQAQIIPLLKFQGNAIPFRVQTLKNYIEEQDDLGDSPHSHNYYEMIWLTRGTGTLHVDMRQYTVENNTIFYLMPNQAHQFQIQEQMEGFIFSFTDSFFSVGEHDFDLACQATLYQLFAEHRTIKVAPEMEEDMTHVISKMIKESESRDSSGMELLKRYFKIFLIYLARTLENKLQSTEQSRETDLVKNFMALLDKNFKEMKMV